MTFLSPALLAGLGVVAAPVAIHLLNKMRVQVVRWGATRFLQESMKKNQRRLQLEDLILLLLRCLLIVLLALAFSRPVINPGAGGGVVPDGPAAVILVLDQSASMSQSNGVETRFDQAKAAAQKILDELGPGSQAAIFLVTDRVTQAVAKPTANVALVRRAVEVSVPSDRSSDLAGGIRVAIDALKAFSGSRKEIVIITDNQALAWQQIDSLKALLAGAPDVNLRVVKLGEKGEDNLAITAIKPESLMPATGQLFGCLVEVTNFGETPVTGVRVTLALNGDVPADEAVIDSINPGQSGAARLNVRFSQAGFQTVLAKIPPDRLPSDNERAMAIEVVDQVRVAIVEGASSGPGQERDGFFLANALVPVPPGRQAEYYLKAEVVPAPWLETGDLTRNDMIILCNVPHPSTAASQKLLQYVGDGGALVIFPGPNVQPDDYNNDPALAEMLPAKMGPLQDPGKSGGFVSWQARDYAHPITALWNDAKNGSLGSVRAGKYFPLTPVASSSGPEKESPQSVVNFTDGTPAVVERSYGRGHVVLFSSGATTQWNNLPIHPNFVPFLQRLAGYVSRRHSPGSLNLLPGGQFRQMVDASLAGRQFSVVPPDSKNQSRPGGRIELVNREGEVRYRDTEKSGPYRLMIAGSDVPFATFAVQMDPKESNLKTIATDPLAGLGKLAGAPGGSSAPVETAPAPGGVRRELWALLVMLGALVALTEMTFAHRFSLSK